VLQCVEVCCSVLQCAAMCWEQFPNPYAYRLRASSSEEAKNVAVCCSVLQCATVCCSKNVAVCCSVLQCVAVCCSVLQCVAVISRSLLIIAPHRHMV